MSKIPPLKLRNLCSKHKESLTAANWPRHGHGCACEWTVQVEDQLVAAELIDAKEIIKYGVNVLSVLKGQRPSDEQLLPRAGGSGPAVAGQMSAAEVAAQREAAKAVEAATKAAGQRGLPPPLAPVGMAALEEGVGGNQDCIKNTGEEYYNFMRRSSAWKAKYFKQVRVQFNRLLSEKGIAHPEEYCFESLSHMAIQ